jgi:hypothetical protein
VPAVPIAFVGAVNSGKGFRAETVLAGIPVQSVAQQLRIRMSRERECSQEVRRVMASAERQSEDFAPCVLQLVDQLVELFGKRGQPRAFGRSEGSTKQMRESMEKRFPPASLVSVRRFRPAIAPE